MGSMLRQQLIEGRRRLDAGEAEWLGRLAEFDRAEAWAADGHLTCVSWLVAECGMRRSTAKEKLRVAHELTRRRVLRDALAGGRLSYSKVRALSRIPGGDDDGDEVLATAAVTLTSDQLDIVVKHARRLAEQEEPPRERWTKRGLFNAGTVNLLTTLRLVLPVEDAERVLRIVDLWLDSEFRRGSGDQAVDEASDGATPDPVAPLTFWQRRADGFLELLEAGLAWLEAGGDVDASRANVDVICDYDTLLGKAGSAELAGGQPLTGDAARRLACDAGIARIITRGPSEVLDVGRRSRPFTGPQRRAIAYRYGGRCAYAGCGLSILSVHHCDPWGQGGRTDLDLGVPLCRGHHDLVHDRGWTVRYDPTRGIAIFTTPDGRTIDGAHPTRIPGAA